MNTKDQAQSQDQQADQAIPTPTPEKIEAVRSIAHGLVQLIHGDASGSRMQPHMMVVPHDQSEYIVTVINKKSHEHEEYHRKFQVDGREMRGLLSDALMTIESLRVSNDQAQAQLRIVSIFEKALTSNESSVCAADGNFGIAHRLRMGIAKVDEKLFFAQGKGSGPLMGDPETDIDGYGGIPLR